MQSVLEILPTEIWFDIFDYLTVLDIFYAFARLNQRLNDLLGVYPLRLDFRQLSRTQFDFLCQCIQGKQVLSLCLSDELIPNQVQIFNRYFPHFDQQFRQLRTLKYVDTLTVLPRLPPSLSFLSIKTYLQTIETISLINELLRQHSQLSLTTLHIDGAYVFQTIDYSFPFLTYLTIDYCTIKEFRRILHSLKSPLTHLTIFLDQNDRLALPSFEQLSTTLLKLNVTFSEGKSPLSPFISLSLNLIPEIVTSFTAIKLWLKDLSHLNSLTLQSTVISNMIDGQQWEEFLLQTNIQDFNFKFFLVHPPNDETCFLQSFRSPFWLAKTHWYVVCERGKFRSSRPLIYSLPYFQSTCIFHPSNHIRSQSIDRNAPCISSHSIHLILTSYESIPSSTIFFSKVFELTLMTTTLPSVEHLQSMMNLEEIQRLDVSLVKTFSSDLFHLLIQEMNNLKVIKMQYNPFYIPPLHIYSYIFIRNDQEVSVVDANNLERFLYLFFHLKFLEITIQSEEILIQLLNRLHYLETIRIYSYNNYLLRIDSRWLRGNIRRLKMMDFTFRATSTSLLIAIGNVKLKTKQSKMKVRGRRLIKSCLPCQIQ